MEIYKKIGDYSRAIFRCVMGFLLFCMVALAAVQVVTRYFVAVTIIWVEELSIYIMCWMCAVGAAWVWMESSGHIRMDILDNVLPQKTIWVMDAAIDAVTAAVSAALIRIGIHTRNVNRGMVMSVINLDEGDRYLPVIAGGILLLLASLYMLVGHIHRLVCGKEDSAS